MNKISNKYIYIILIVFAVLNIKTVSWRLTEDHPTPYFEDEGTTLTLLANLNPKKGDFKPFFLGDPALYYLMVGGFTYVYDRFEKLVGFDAGDIRKESLNHKGVEYTENHYLGLKAVYVGRILTLLFALGTIFLIYRIGTEFWSLTSGFLAAIVYSVMSAVVWTSHYATPNHAATFFITASLYFTFIYLSSETRKGLVPASIFAGIALSTKYTAVAIIAAMFLATITKNWRKSKKTMIRDFGTSGLIIFFSSFVTCPFMYIYIPEFIKSFNWIRGQAGMTKWYFLDFPGTFYGYVDVIGIPILILFILSLLVSINKRQKQNAVLFIFLAIFYIVTLKIAGSITEERMLPMLVFMALIIGGGMNIVLNKLRKTRYLYSVVIGVLALVITFEGVYAYSINSYYYYNSVQGIVSKYIEDNIPEGSRIAILHGNDRFCDPGIILKHMNKEANQKNKDDDPLLLKDLTHVSGHWKLTRPSYNVSKINSINDVYNHDYLILSIYDSIIAGEDIRKISYLKYRNGNHLNEKYYRDYDNAILTKRSELLSRTKNNVVLEKVAVIDGSYNLLNNYFMTKKRPDYTMFYYGPFTIYRIVKG